MQRIACTPTLILYNARVYTQDDALPWAQAVAIQQDRIVAVGADDEILPLAGEDTRRIDADGRLVLPGFCDAHIHLSHYALGLREVRLAGARTRAEMLERIREAATRAASGSWLVGQGWNESWWGDTDFPTAAEIDAATGAAFPAIFYRSDMHSAVVNSAALRLAGVTAQTPNPPGGVIDRDASGQPTGFLRELAIDLVAQHAPPPSADELDAAISAGMTALHRLGITAVHAQRVKDGDDGPREWASLLRLREASRLHLRVACNVAAHELPHLAGLGLRTGFGDDFLRLGHVKVFTDGSLGSRTAWLLAPFVKLRPEETDNTGVSVTPPAQMAAEFRRATELGFPISVHAIGDRANRVVLDIFEELAGSGLAPSIPHRIEHVQIIDPVDLPRLAQLGITASVQPIHATDDMDTADRFLGERAAHLYNFRSLLEQGTLLAFGSDAPVADPNPFVGLHAALVRQRIERLPAASWYGAECISLEQGIYAYTLGAARAAGWEQAIGSITPGKLADLIVVDRDLFALRADEIAAGAVAATAVVTTIFGGEPVFRI
ncbi:amidohydrolase [Caldilinea sp.]|uniref:amidohydrolase n=1 Tax=Caldilinea sp. TaxID=2293560 RepID=UPI002CAEFD09|nr:amidohydrolase [Caldilinea sp.]